MLPQLFKQLIQNLQQNTYDQNHIKDVDYVLIRLMVFNQPFSRAASMSGFSGKTFPAPEIEKEKINLNNEIGYVHGCLDLLISYHI